MVFPSVPVLYLDPSNWQQQHNQQGAGNENHHIPPQQPLPPPGGGGGGGAGDMIRPGSMADKARLAKLPQPEAALKCPRCESTNTKFCYFNNYSLTQPRHFCKTCRRYWTRGGALRSVPVGGGCRRNKRSKGSSSNRSKSPAGTGSSCSSGLIASNSCTSSDGIIGHMRPPPPAPSQLSTLFPPLHNLGDYNIPTMGLNIFSGINSDPQGETNVNGGVMDFQIGSASSSIIPSGFVEPWRMQPQAQQLFPFLAMETQTPTGLYPYQSDGIQPPDYVGHSRPKPLVVAGDHNQAASVKMEEDERLNNLSRNSSGVSGNGADQYWPGRNAWSDLPGFTSSSSTSHLL
ncbi:hypothetical protein Tsubulata_041985 [Turnera subulata]|uniref:Dof zinc finger protein n=1 Tax=Turnera subulata TaxID=218843 RepID=A0A9Q0JNA2_9ROSI|nr:hypothetical protein Tsubulata_041985 [Turnera subulata]